MKSAPRKVDESPVAPEKAAPPVFEETRETQGSVNAEVRFCLVCEKPLAETQLQYCSRAHAGVALSREHVASNPQEVRTVKAARSRQSRAARREREARAALVASQPYTRPVLVPRQAPEGFEVLCPHASHCWHSAMKQDEGDVRITEKCCGCERTRTLAKVAIKPESPVTHEAEHKLVRRWQKA